MSVFPQELYDIVISLCDHLSLASCSLTCRSWVPSSRIRLFANLRPLIISPSSLPEVLLLVDGPVSTISPYIRALVLKDWLEGTSTSNTTSFYALLPRLTGRMVAVESLMFHGTDWEEMADGALKFLVFYFKDTLKALELRDCTCRTFHSLVDLACSFPLLEKLSLHRLVRINPPAPEEMYYSLPAPRHLRSIHALGHIKQELVRWITQSNLGIEAVTFGPILPSEALPVGKFLRFLKTNLKHITLSGESVANIHRGISLKHNRQLSSIHFTDIMLYHSDTQASMVWFIHILHGIQSSSIRSLQLGVCVHSKSVKALEAVDWPALSTCLDKPQFVCLNSVKFSFTMSPHKSVDDNGQWWDGYTEMAEKFVRERLPQFQDTSILCFDFGRVVDATVVDSESDDDM